MRRGLGYRSVTHERSLREFARYLDGHEGPIPLETTLEWATSTSSTNPRNAAHRLGRVRGLLRHLHAMDGETDVPAPGCSARRVIALRPTSTPTPRSPPFWPRQLGWIPPGGLRPSCYVTLFGLLACTGLRISEALALSCADVDLNGALITVRAGKRGLTRLVPLHPSAVAALADYVAERERRYSAPGPGEAFFRTEASERISYSVAHHAFCVVRRRLGWTADGRTRAPRVHDLRHRMVVRRIEAWHAQGVDVDAKIPVLATYVGHVEVRTSIGISPPFPN